MKRNPHRAAAIRALRSLNIHPADAEAIIDAAAELQAINEETWGDARYWWAVNDGDDAPYFWLGIDEYGKDAWMRPMTERERVQIATIRWSLRHHPGLVAIYQPAPGDPAISITRAPRPGKTTEIEGLIILPFKHPADDDTLN